MTTKTAKRPADASKPKATPTTDAPPAAPPEGRDRTISDGLQSIVDRAIQRNVKGLQYLGSAAPSLGVTPKDVVLKRGTLNLYHYLPLADEIYRIPVLMVMATTNRGYIFDLAPGNSLIEYLLKAGFDVFVVDWSPPAPEEKTLGLDDYVCDFLPRCVEAVREISGEPDVSLVGYCMGGVLATMYAARNATDPPANLVCFTTPVDFSQMTMFRKWSDERYFDVDRLVDTLGNVPSEIIFSSFEMLRPATRIAGRLQMLESLWNDEAIKTFRRFERWSTDTLPLPGEYFRQTTKEFFWKNSLFEGKLVLRGEPVDLGKITSPFLHIIAEHDHIVPPECARPLVAKIASNDKEQLMLKGGHVSLVAGPNASRRMWPALDAWLAQRSA